MACYVLRGHSGEADELEAEPPRNQDTMLAATAGGSTCCPWKRS